MGLIARNFLRASLRLFFKHLYTTFAWAYDLVAWTTSMGQWQTWQSAVLEVLPEGKLLEVGHGPGHLLIKLTRSGRTVFGVDSSPQMIRIATQRLRNNTFHPNVIRGQTQHLPLPSGYFSGVISTFPSEYIYHPDTLGEIHRVLQKDGILIIIGSAQFHGNHLTDRFAAWLYRTTGQSGEPIEGWEEPLLRLGFSVRLDRVHQPRALVLRVVAQKVGL